MKAGGTVVNYSLDAERVSTQGRRQRDRHPRDARPQGPLPADGSAARDDEIENCIISTVAEMTPAPEGIAAQMSHNGETVTVPKDSRHVTFEEFLNNDGEYFPNPVADLRHWALLNTPAARPGSQKALCSRTLTFRPRLRNMLRRRIHQQLLDEGQDNSAVLHVTTSMR